MSDRLGVVQVAQRVIAMTISIKEPWFDFLTQDFPLSCKNYTGRLEFKKSVRQIS